MKKLLLLSALLIFACSSDDSSNTNDNINNNELLNCDGNPVPTIVYGTQEWTVENACHITYRDGTPIPQVSDAQEWANLTTGAWCYYDNNPNLGVLYNFFAVKGIHDNNSNTPNKHFAPDGWRVPNLNDWNNLENYLVDNGFSYTGEINTSYHQGLNRIAPSMASQSYWGGCDAIILDYSIAGTPESERNSSGFNAIKTGRRAPNGSYVGRDCESSFHINGDNAERAILLAYEVDLLISSGGISNQNGITVRLIKD